MFLKKITKSIDDIRSLPLPFNLLLTGSPLSVSFHKNECGISFMELTATLYSVSKPDLVFSEITKIRLDVEFQC